MPVSVFVQDVGENGFYLSAVDQVLCLAIKSITAQEPAARNECIGIYFGDKKEVFLSQIIPKIKPIAPQEAQRLIQRFPERGRSTSCFAAAPGNPGPAGTVDQDAESPAYFPLFPSVLPTVPQHEQFPTFPQSVNPAAEETPAPLSITIPSHSADVSYPKSVEARLFTSGPRPFFVTESNRPPEAPSIRGVPAPFAPSTPAYGIPNVHGKYPSAIPGSGVLSAQGTYPWVTPASEIPSAQATYSDQATYQSSNPESRIPDGYQAASPPVRKTSAFRKRKNATGIEWTNEKSAFLVYYLGQGYLLSQIRRMFSHEFQGITPTFKDMNEELDWLEKAEAEYGQIKLSLVHDVERGAIKFNMHPVFPIPSTRRECTNLLVPPFRIVHKTLVAFFRGVGLDKSLVQELFETHFGGVIANGAFNELWTTARAPKKLAIYAYNDDLFKYLEEGQIGYVDCREVQKKVAKEQARVRSARKRESILKEFRRVEAKEKEEAAAWNVDGATQAQEVTEGSTQTDTQEEGDFSEDISMGSIGGEPYRKERSERDQERPRGEKDRSRSPN